MNYNNIYPFKGRKIDLGPVKIYRNLNCRDSRRLYSIMQGGLVRAHTDRILLRDCKLEVSEAGRQRVLKTKRKNVHAFIIGHIAGSWRGLNASISPVPKITYNPYKDWSFMYVDFHVGEAQCIIINKYGVSGMGLG